ncbi:phage tail protein [Xanthomarina sp. F2636L]|uniref:phage tail protein n=1 Tax=Xanthomarina sp. F2636L TaxID=2996018 RepID=UPI00225E0502|nr:phage tail protein [Xanthomarina sp. F2636L]MCX7549597.1 phage tail protein [Xanthomarina sp. F2636L]
MPRSTYPPLNMHFAVDFDYKELRDDKNFQSVQGLKVRVCENENKKGTYVKFDNIILKRAYQPESHLVKWCMDTINNHKIKPINLTVKLLNADHEILSAWNIEKAVPVAWGVDELHAQDTKILIETIELSYLRFKVLTTKRNVKSPIRKK